MLKPYLTKKELSVVYFSCIRSIMEYCSVAFYHQLNKQEKVELNKIQKRAHNIICSYNCSCDILGDLEQRRLQATKNLFNKIKDEDELHPLKHMLYPTNNSGRYVLPHCTNNTLLKSFFYAMSLTHNNTRPNTRPHMARI